MPFRLASLLPALLTLSATAEIPLKLERFDGPSLSFRTTAPGTVEVQGPMSVLAVPSMPAGPDDLVLEMEYFCAGGIAEFPLLPGPPFEAATARRLPALGHSETWSAYTARIAPQDQPMPDGWRQLRFDFPLPQGRLLQIRNARLRPERPGEFDTAPSAAWPGKDALETYLDHTFPIKIAAVSVTENTVEIEGSTGGETTPLLLADIPMDLPLGAPPESQTPIEVSPTGIFKISLPRFRQRDGRRYDRLTSRWQIIRRDDLQPLSHARYSGEIVCRAPNLPSAKPASKKGLGGWQAGRIPGELADLGISAVTVNVMIHTLVSLVPEPGATPFEWQGRVYHARENALARYDATFLEAQQRGAMVSAILLVANPARDSSPVAKLLAHPDATRDGTFAMPDVTSDDGISLYGAILNLMAERWSRPDGKYGRVHHWIMHNEVDAGWVWTNAGEKEDTVYMDLYQRSMRLMDLIARQYDPHSRPFITLTHHWAHRGDPRWYGSKRMIDLLARFSRAEGDFPWAVAYHPYPQDLFNPRTWEDDQATFTFDTHKITPKNLEVLDAYMKRTELLHRGQVRPVHLSENGFNSRDYSEKELTDQAAGMALAWKKIARLSSIESWQYHNWIDNRHEGGLRIGLRKFPDESDDPLGKKPIWHLYRALGTPEENAASAPYLDTIGIASWDEIIHREPIR